MPDESREQQEKSSESKAIRVMPPPVVRKHNLTVKGTTLRYRSECGTMKLESDEGKHQADVSFVAYVLEGAAAKKRPLTFAFNGGPGSSAVWLHMGALGPRTVVMDDDGNPLPAPHALRDNVHTWLRWTDLVFIDPVGTGYSRPVSDTKREEFHGVKEDIQSVAEFIRRWTSENARWLSPKFVAGESYGTTRAAGMIDHLQQVHGMTMSGLILISSVLSFQTIAHVHSTVNDLPYICFLPSLAATSWFHKKLPARYQKDFDVLMRDVREFALKDYTVALTRGHQLDEQSNIELAARLSEFTGLSTDFIRQCNNRINPMRYMKELLRSERKTVGRLDSRFTGSDSDAAGDRPQDDQSYANILGVYTAGVNDYIRRELGYESPITYEVLTPKVHPWKWGDADRGYVNVADNLARAMRLNTHLKVFIANGYYDLATPFVGTEFTLHHLEVEKQELERVTMKYYHAGHMMYIHKPSLVKMTRDVQEFYKSCV